MKLQDDGSMIGDLRMDSGNNELLQALSFMFEAAINTDAMALDRDKVVDMLKRCNEMIRENEALAPKSRRTCVIPLGPRIARELAMAWLVAYGYGNGPSEFKRTDESK